MLPERGFVNLFLKKAYPGYSILGTEPASENRMRSCRGSTPGIRFYCKPVFLVRCRDYGLLKQTEREPQASPEGMPPRSGAQMGGENRFSGRVVGKCLCEMTSAFIINELRGVRALRLVCGRELFAPQICS